MTEGGFLMLIFLMEPKMAALEIKTEAGESDFWRNVGIIQEKFANT